MNAPKNINTMKVPEELMKYLNYESVYNYYKYCLQRFNGTSEFLLSYDTYQFDDYSKYESSMFDEKHKAKVKEEQFPIDCLRAFEIGARLASLGR